MANGGTVDPFVMTRTPLRVSFAGGGTDLADFYDRETGVAGARCDRRQPVPAVPGEPGGERNDQDAMGVVVVVDPIPGEADEHRAVEHQEAR